MSAFFREFRGIADPGTLDGGDICDADGHFLIGISDRTNEEGGRQLAVLLAEEDYTSSFVDIRAVEGILHLKSGIAYVGDGRVVSIGALAHHPALQSFQIIRVEPSEAFAANCVRVSDRLLMAAGHPRLGVALRHAGFEVMPLEVSEFQKMDGGLSCLSLRF